MTDKITTFQLPLPFHMGQVNCYLVETEAGFYLIDTGGSSNRKQLVDMLEKAGCKAGMLKLIILTHGDFNHCGNAAYLHQTFGPKIFIHADDAGMVERGDMFFSRKKPNIIIKTLLPLFSDFGAEQRFTPDVLLGDEADFSEFGFNARAISIPGHSKGSIGVLTSNRHLFCGDLLVNNSKPTINSLMDDPKAAMASIEKLEGLGVTLVYPGHGRPFQLNQIFEADDS
jgi:hydroxyacylglutathione hydrolase